MNDYRIRHVSITTPVTAQAGNDLLTSDFQTKREGTLVRVCIVVAAAVEVQLVPNTGSTIQFQSTALVADVVNVFELTLDPARTWNLASPAGDGLPAITVNMLLIDEVNA